MTVKLFVFLISWGFIFFSQPRPSDNPVGKVSAMFPHNSIVWSYATEGPSHQPTITATARINGHEGEFSVQGNFLFYTLLNELAKIVHIGVIRKTGIILGLYESFTCSI